MRHVNGSRYSLGNPQAHAFQACLAFASLLPGNEIEHSMCCVTPSPSLCLKDNRRENNASTFIHLAAVSRQFRLKCSYSVRISSGASRTLCRSSARILEVIVKSRDSALPRVYPLPAGSHTSAGLLLPSRLLFSIPSSGGLSGSSPCFSYSGLIFASVASMYVVFRRLLLPLRPVPFTGAN